MADTKSGKRARRKVATRATHDQLPPAQGAGTPTQAAAAVPAGMNEARHAAAQRTAQRAEALREVLFPAIMAGALRYDSLFDAQTCQAFLQRLLEDAGNPVDPVEVMLLQQLALAHFRIAQLHAGAGQAQALEAVKVYNGAAARLWGEFRRTALALRLYRGRLRADETQTNLKIHKLAQ